LPTALVTTPESLTLLLARADWRERFAHLGAIVVDEWHELMGTKRGVQAELALARTDPPACLSTMIALQEDSVRFVRKGPGWQLDFLDGGGTGDERVLTSSGPKTIGLATGPDGAPHGFQQLAPDGGEKVSRPGRRFGPVARLALGVSTPSLRWTVGCCCRQSANPSATPACGVGVGGAFEPECALGQRVPAEAERMSRGS